ncbi:MAG: hypothetical protein AVDCRST_MAG52-816, partial [uncultured Blastococcus sp.]
GTRALRRPAPPRPAHRGRCRRRGGPRPGGAAHRTAGVRGPPGTAQRAVPGGRGDHRPARPRLRRRPAPRRRPRLRRHPPAGRAAARPGRRLTPTRGRGARRRPRRGRHAAHHAAAARAAEVPRRRGRGAPGRLGQHLAGPRRRRRHGALVPPVLRHPSRPVVRRLAVHRMGAL